LLSPGHDLLLTHSPNWRFSLMMELCRETIHRRNSVRQTALADLDLETGTITWRGEFDKNGLEITTPLTQRALQVIEEAPRIPGSPWLIPAEEDPSQPVSIHVLNLWLQRAKDRAGLKVKGLGFHAQKRAGVRRKEFRKFPAKVQEALTGTNYETLRLVHDDVSLDEMREAMDELEPAKGELRGSSAVGPPANRRRPSRTGETQMSLRLTPDE
jgi:integrase